MRNQGVIGFERFFIAPQQLHLHIGQIQIAAGHILGQRFTRVARKGSDVTRPDFGSNHFDYIDTPEDVFVPNIVREVVLAIQTWETRAVVDEVTFSGNAPHITMTVRWRVADEVSGEIYGTTLNLEHAAWI